MKTILKKFFSYVLLIILVINVVGCTVVENVINSDSETDFPNTVEETMIEELQNGQDKIINSPSRIDGIISEWIHNNKATLTTLIADQTNLEINKVNIMLSPIDTTENSSKINIACTIVLDTDSKLDDKTINNIVESIIKNISSQSTINAYISKDNIVITNRNNDLLY